MKKAVIIGAGNLGRGLLGIELSRNDYCLAFIDKDPNIVKSLNKNKGYAVNFFGPRHPEKVTIEHAYSTDQPAEICGAILRADLLFTAVGAQNLKSAGEIISSAYRGLTYRRSAYRKSEKPGIVVACENVPENSARLKEHIRLERRCQENLEFANCVVDRICLSRDGSLIVEDPFEWIIETTRQIGKGKIRDGQIGEGIRTTKNLRPYFARKQFLVNGLHGILGYAGNFHGVSYVHDAVNHPTIRALIEEASEEMEWAIRLEYGYSRRELSNYAKQVMARFANPEVEDGTARLVRDPIRKLQVGERFMAPALLAYSHGIYPENICKGIAYLLLYHGDDQGKQIEAMLKEDGVLSALSNYTGLDQDHPIIQEISRQYYTLEKK